MELFDTSVYPDLVDPIDCAAELTEGEALGYCNAGDVPDGWDGRILLSGEIEVHG